MDLSEQAISFIQNLSLVGDFHGQPFVLRPWQEQILNALFRTKDGKRVVSKMLLLLPRKNAKSTLIAALCLFSVLCLGKNQQILLSASSESQALRVFEIIGEMVSADATLRQLCEIIPSKNRLVVEANNSFIQVVTSGGDALHGYSPTVVVMDELHAWNQPKHRRLHAALTTGSGARLNPLTLIISTQTSDKHSLLSEEFEYARKLKGRIENGKVKKSGQYENESYGSSEKI